MHIPVLQNEVLELLVVRDGGVYIDGTLGSGGHAQSILEKAGPEAFLLGIDRDEEALERARAKLGDKLKQSVLVQGNYSDMLDIAKTNNISQVDGILLDIGVSSDQLDTPERGFSFQDDGPLDMRMDRSSGRTAEDLVNDAEEGELVEVIRDLGEERMAKRISKAIIRARMKKRITRTAELAEIVSKGAGGRRGRIHPATRTFQALRIAVNNELDVLREGLKAGLDLLAPNGRMAVISFHSLEDRIAKKFFAAHAGRWESLQAGGEEWVGEEPMVSLINRKVIKSSDDESKNNPRSRSAKLRVIERINREE